MDIATAKKILKQMEDARWNYSKDHVRSRGILKETEAAWKQKRPTFWDVTEERCEAIRVLLASLD